MSARPLNDARVLVVEDEPLIALDICDMLAGAGAAVIGPASTVARALALVETRALAAAVLDFRLDGETVLPVAAALSARSVPFAFHTGDKDGQKLCSTHWPDSEVLSKPANRAAIVATVAKLLGGV